MGAAVEWLLVALFGALVGASELINRYKDAPFPALQSKPAIFYILLNAAAAAGTAFSRNQSAFCEKTIFASLSPPSTNP